MVRRSPASQDSVLLSPDDPRRPLKVRRLQAEKERITTFLDRDPSMDDPEFEEWDLTVRTLLAELFDPATYLIRFRKLTFRTYVSGFGGREWYGDPPEAWKAALRNADKILAEAIEEASIALPNNDPPLSRPIRPGVIVNIHNENVFSPTVHVTLSSTLVRLESMDLSQPERVAAREALTELDAETNGAKRWPIIARSLETVKSLGGGIYKDLAVPLIVEFLKHEAGLSK